MRLNVRHTILCGLAVFTLLGTAGCAGVDSRNSVDDVKAAVLESSAAVADVSASKGLDGFESFLSVNVQIAKEQFDATVLADTLVAVGGTVPANVAAVRFRAVSPEGVPMNLDPQLASLGIDAVSMMSPTRANIPAEALRQFAERTEK